jgi:hypothetical protein
MSKDQFKPLNFEQSGLNKEEWRELKSLSNPKKIQNFLNSLKFNFEKRGETHKSVRETLRTRTAHCFEGGLLATAALWVQGRRPLLLDLKTVRPDFDHIVALFQDRETGTWGAISKTNHAVLRYREPVYRDIRELAMSYFHEYFLFSGKKTLRSFSEPFDLSKIMPDHSKKKGGGVNWLTTEENLAPLVHVIDLSPHTKIVTPKQVKNFRKADKIEIAAGKLTEYK